MPIWAFLRVVFCASGRSGLGIFLAVQKMPKL